MCPRLMPRSQILFLALAIHPISSVAQSLITTVAGGAPRGGLLATESLITSLNGVALAADGSVYLTNGGQICRIDPSTGVLTAVAGATNATNSADGPALSVRIQPSVLVGDKLGSIYFLDPPRLRKLDTVAGTITTIVPSMSINAESGLAIDASGYVYVTDNNGNRVYKISTQNGSVTVIAGSGTTGGFAGDGGLANSALLNGPQGVAVDGNGNVYVADMFNHRIRMISSGTGIITTIAGNASEFQSGDGGPALQAGIQIPYSLAADAAGNIYFGDVGRVRRIDAVTHIVTTLAGGGAITPSTSPTSATQSLISEPKEITIDLHGSLYLADGAGRVELVTTTAMLTSIAGIPQDGDGGPAVGANLGFGGAVAVAPSGDLYFLETGQPSSLRRISASTGLISTLTSLSISASSIAIDPAGDVVVASSSQILRVNSASGSTQTVSGVFETGCGGIGPPSSPFIGAIAMDAKGNLFVADQGDLCVRRVDAATGAVTIVAGNGASGLAIDGAAAANSPISPPTGIAISSTGDVYISGSNGGLGQTVALTKVTANGIVHPLTAAGCDYTRGDGGLALDAPVCGAEAIAIDADGNVFFTDYLCKCVRQITASTGTVQTVAGGGSSTSDGVPAVQAALANPGALAIGNGTLYISDNGTPTVTPARVLGVTPAAPPSEPQPPNITGVVNAASFQPASSLYLGSPGISPGEIITIYGNYLGPLSPTSLQVGPDGRVTTTLAGVQVLVNGAPAPLLYVSPGQINAVAPFGTSSNGGTASVEITSGTLASAVTTLRVMSATAGIFGGLVFNQDFSINSAQNPAAKGSSLILFGTGFGVLSPSVPDGTILSGQTLPTVASIASAFFEANSQNVQADLLYKGAAPGFVAGVDQIDILIPTTLPSGQLIIGLYTFGAPDFLSETVYIK